MRYDFPSATPIPTPPLVQWRVIAVSFHWQRTLAGTARRFVRPSARSTGRHRLGADKCGVVALEFALVAPVFLFFLFSIFGVGLAAFYQQSLDDAVRDAARQVQMKTAAASSGSGFVSAVCAEFGILAINCSNNLTYAVSAGTIAGGFISLTPQSLSLAGAFDNSFFAGVLVGPRTPVLLQVAYPLPFSLPYVGSMITSTGTNSIVTTAAVVMEPYQ